MKNPTYPSELYVCHYINKDEAVYLKVTVSILKSGKELHNVMYEDGKRPQ